MSSETESNSNEATPAIPLGQRLFDNWPLLMVAGIAIMVAIYTVWGLWEVMTMPTATLP